MKEIDVPVGKKFMLAVKSLDMDDTVEIIRVECAEDDDQNRCYECAFRHRKECCIYQCYSVFRRDGKSVYYKKIEVVDEKSKKSNMSRKFDLDAALNGAKIRTRCGYPVRLVATDLKGDMPLLALVNEGAKEVAIQYTRDGKLINDKSVSSNYDLVTYERRYLNVFRRGNKYFCGKRSYQSLEMAREMDGYVLHKVKGSVHVATIEVEEQ